MNFYNVSITGIGTLSALGTKQNDILKVLHQEKSLPIPTEKKALSQWVQDPRMFQCPDFETPKKFRHLPTPHKMSYYTLKEALEDSGLTKRADFKKLRGCVIWGGSTCDLSGGESYYQKASSQNKKDLLHSNLDHISHFLSLVLRQEYGANLKPHLTVLAACSTSHHAISLGAMLIEQGEVDFVMVGASDAISLTTFSGFNALQNISPERKCKSLDQKRDGLVFGEGSSCWVMEPLSGSSTPNKVYGKISQINFGLESYHMAIPDPTGIGHKRVISKMDLDNIDYVKVHGTATPQNDEIEIRALEESFEKLNLSHKVPLGALKPYIGHTMGACGLIENSLVLKMMEENILLPNLNLTEPIESNIFDLITKNTQKDIRKVLCLSAAGRDPG